MNPSLTMLYDVHLHHCPDGWLQGEWRVRSQGPLAMGAPDSVLHDASGLGLQPNGQLRVDLINTRDAETGTWVVERDERLHRPYLRLHLPEGEVRALVTRLQRSSDGQQAQLTLYLQTGMELVLSLGDLGA